MKSQLQEYINRPVALSEYNVIDYFTHTYDKHKGHNGPPQNSQERIRRGRPFSERHEYVGGYRTNHVRIVRTIAHETMPQFIGKWFPRNDHEELRLQYILTMLSVLKPWWKMEELMQGHSTANVAWTSFCESSKGRYDSFLENIQYFYRCSNQSSACCAKEYETYEASSTQDRDEADEEEAAMELNVALANSEDLYDEAQLYAAQEQESLGEEQYGQMALECAYNAGIFARSYSQTGPINLSSRATALDEAVFGNWMSYLKEHAEEVLLQTTVCADEALLDGPGETSQLDATITEVPTECRTQVARTTNILNQEQQLAYDIVSNHMHATTNGSRPPQLRLILRGPGGTGKTAVINAITDAFRDSGMQAKLAKTATSGVAATLISGKTLHTWAGIPIMVPRKDNWLQASPVIAQRRIMHLKDVEYLIIDEISMATKDLLGMLNGITGNVCASLEKEGGELFFGSLNVILCGDFHQFLPVGNPTGALYDCTFQHTGKKSRFMEEGFEVYRSFDRAVTLKEQMRVRDAEWIALLGRLRMGSCSCKDIDLLHTLRLDLPENDLPDFSTLGWENAVLITPRHSVRKRWNAAAVRRHCAKTKERLYSAPAEDTAKGTTLLMSQRMIIAKRNSKETANLAHRVKVAIGMKVMIVLNIATESDLANGT